MRTLAVVLVLTSAALAQDYDRLTEWIEAEQFERAYEVLRKARVADVKDEGVWWELWGRAVKGVARDRQRKSGYGAAIEFLEGHLESKPIVDHYAETCIWAGEEARGLRRIRALRQPLRDESTHAEFQLLWVRQDYAGMEARALETNWTSWVEFARKERELRERFEGRTTRAWWVALGGIGAILCVVFVVDRLFVRSAEAAASR